VKEEEYLKIVPDELIVGAVVDVGRYDTWAGFLHNLMHQFLRNS
jgi:hypothetical protein